MFRRRLRASVGFYGANLIGRMAQSQAVTRDLASTLLRPGSKLGAMLRQPAARVLFVSIVLAALAAQAAPDLDRWRSYLGERFTAGNAPRRTALVLEHIA